MSLFSKMPTEMLSEKIKLFNNTIKSNNLQKKKLIDDNRSIRAKIGKIKAILSERRSQENKVKKQKIRKIRLKLKKSERKVGSIEKSIAKDETKSSSTKTTKKNITISMMKNTLDKEGIKYKKTLKKDELLSLVRKHNLVRKCYS